MESPSANAGLDILSQPPQVIHHHLIKEGYGISSVNAGLNVLSQPQVVHHVYGHYVKEDLWNIIKVGLGIPSPNLSWQTIKFKYGGL